MSKYLSAGTIAAMDFKGLFESTPGSFLVLTPDFVIVAVSDEFANATMTVREAIMGKNIFDVFPDNPDDVRADGVSKMLASLQTVLKNRSTHIMGVQKYDIRRPDGAFEERYWSPLNKPVLNKKNQVAYIIHRVEDVTDFVKLQKLRMAKDKIASDLKARTQELEIEIYKHSREIEKLNEELEQKVARRTIQLESLNRDITDYKFALDASSIVAISDQKGIIKYVNDNFCEISGYSMDELIGLDHRVLNSGLHTNHYFHKMWATISNGGIWKGEFRNKARNGNHYWVDCTIVPFLDESGKPYQYVSMSSDITQKKIAEENLLKLKEALEEKVKERTLELTHSLEREKTLNEMKSRFVSTASHEFRTPLSAILTSVSLLEKYAAPEQAEKRKKHFERVKLSVKILTGILEDFLSIEKLEQGKTEIRSEDFDLVELAENMKGEMESMLKPGQLIRCTHLGEAGVLLDKKIIRNILLNLLSNASKYSTEGKQIDLETAVSEKQIIIRVHDQGIGIPEKEHKNLFKIFYRATNAEAIQGTGLGLTIVKRYVEILGGEITFTSLPGVGTTFQVTISKQGIDKQ